MKKIGFTCDRYFLTTSVYACIISIYSWTLYPSAHLNASKIAMDSERRNYYLNLETLSLSSEFKQHNEKQEKPENSVQNQLPTLDLRKVHEVRY